MEPEIITHGYGPELRVQDSLSIGDPDLEGNNAYPCAICVRTDRFLSTISLDRAQTAHLINTLVARL